jgi:hypothetical protein
MSNRSERRRDTGAYRGRRGEKRAWVLCDCCAVDWELYPASVSLEVALGGASEPLQLRHPAAPATHRAAFFHSTSPSRCCLTRSYNAYAAACAIAFAELFIVKEG